jgi:indole-3-glycerol phosphate synthase
MSDALARICAEKWQHVARQRARRPFATVEAAARAAPPPRDFAGALDAAVAAGGFGLIAELKKASPSRGLIRAEFDPTALARAYAAGGAACLSVLTDTPYFQGTDADLGAARAAVALPVLRKDFMLDPYQVLEARALGADCILLIMAALADDQAAELEAQAVALGMAVLVEVHDEAELERALRLRTRLLGINNRNLKTLTVDLATTERLAALAPPGRTLVCESGLERHADLVRMAACGVRRFLVGEALMRAADVAAATRALLGDGAPALAPKAAGVLSHLDAEGRARMVDVSGKEITERTASAGATVLMQPATLARIIEGGIAKGDVLAVARLAGIMAAKRTPELIPLCHPLGLDAVSVELSPDRARGALEIVATCRLNGRTGVEMEALTAAAIAALTVYDMCKAIDRAMRITDLRLLHKAGGRSGEFRGA